MFVYLLCLLLFIKIKDESSSEVQTNENKYVLQKNKNAFNINNYNNDVFNKSKTPKSIYYEISEISGYESYFIDDFDILYIDCPQKYLFFIQYMKGLEANVYEIDEYTYDKKLISTITEKSSVKIINFEKSKGEIVIKKLQTSSKILNSNEPILYFSFFNLGSAERRYSTECDDIYISTNPYFEYFIKGPKYQADGSEKINYTLSNRKTFCLWLTFPLSVLVFSKSYLPHLRKVYEDTDIYNIPSPSASSVGYSLFYMLIKSNSTNNTQYATYNAVPVWESLLSQYANYEKFSAFFKGGNSSDDGDDGNNGSNVDENPKNKNNKSMIIIIISIVAAVVVLAIIITITVVCVKRRSKGVAGQSSSP